MFVIDVNTSFGKRVDPDPRYRAESLVDLLRSHRVGVALTHSVRGVTYDMCAGNRDTLEVCGRFPELLPAAVIDPRDEVGWRAELRRARGGGCRAIRFFPGYQGWSVDSFLFGEILEELRGSGVLCMFSLADGQSSWEHTSRIARATADRGVPVAYTDIGYVAMAEVIAAMREYPHLYAETNWLTTIDAVEIMADRVGSGRLLFGSGAPGFPIQKSLNQVLESALPDSDKARILGENAAAVLRIPPDVTVGFPQVGAEPVGFDEPIIDVHSHLGHWFVTCRDEDYDPRKMIERMSRFGIRSSVVSSYESMRYDIAAGNRAIAEAIAPHPQLLGYVEVDPYHLELSCTEMDRWFRLPNFVGVEVELTHIPCPTDSPKVSALMAELGKRGRPVLLKTHTNADAEAERRLARENPGLPIVHAHGFDADWANVVADTPTICVEHNLSRPSHWDIRDTIDLLGAERVLFGSDQTLLSPGAEIGLYVDAGMSPAERQAVLHGNAERLFRIP